ncbi:MAG TPA: hypothetical protein VJN18_35840 [Polyangiaceae bacterium]|nr:hypothetical protein [Polyangiaceae bacterium]
MDAGLYRGHTNVPHEKRISYKFFPDAGNQPTVPRGPLNLQIASVVWVSQGLYRITLRGPAVNIVQHDPVLNVNAAGVVRFAQPGPVANIGTSTATTVDVLVVDASAAVQNPPAANANNFISGTIILCDTAAV